VVDMRDDAEVTNVTGILRQSATGLASRSAYSNVAQLSLLRRRCFERHLAR
jgi:hypothetical protein